MVKTWRIFLMSGSCFCIALCCFYSALFFQSLVYSFGWGSKTVEQSDDWKAPEKKEKQLDPKDIYPNPRPDTSTICTEVTCA